MDTEDYSGHTILIVDDEPRNVRILQKSLEKKYILDTAASGEDALEKMKEKVPAVMLLDIMMPGMDGYEVCRVVRRDPAFQLVKIILISGKAMVEERLQGYEAGANDYVTKPFVREELEAKVKVFMKLVHVEEKLLKINRSLEDEVKARTEQLLKAERMAFLGMHSAEIVHNLKNPLTIIQGYASLLEKTDPDNVFGKKIKDAGHRLGDIIKSILDTTAVSTDKQKSNVNINKTIEEELEFLKLDKFYASKVEVRLDLLTVPTTIGIESHFRQIWGNLIKNAAEAMINSEERVLTIKSCENDGFVEIVIQDSGEGISKDNLEKIFEPLFTTKATDGDEGDGPIGTGLGLSSCKRMIEGYGGTLTLESKIGEGTTFVTRIPIK